MPVKRVAVLGAGAAGLNCARHLQERRDLFEFIVYEQTGSVGGTWVYTDLTGKDPKTGLPIHSSMYKNLKTNIAKEGMNFPDFPFPRSDKSFVHHTVVLKYLEDYCRHFALDRFIKFHTYVTEVKPVSPSSHTKWSVAAKCLKSGQVEVGIFDAVMVCVGRYSAPLYPKIPGLDEFEGTVLHSHDYRSAEGFEDQKVVVLGAGPSGVDIVLEVAEVAEEVILSHNLQERIPSKLPPNVYQEVGINSISKSGITFKNERTYSADSIILCTGYEVRFDFLTKDCNITVDQNRVSPLYKHFIHTQYPSICFIGIPFRVIPFLVFDFQVRVYIKMLASEISLPDKDTMDQDSADDLKKRFQEKMPYRHAHMLPGKYQWDYLDSLASIGGIERVPNHFREIYEITSKQRKTNLWHYKNFRFSVSDEGCVKCFEL